MRRPCPNAPRARTRRSPAVRDGGQILLLAGFLLAAAIIIAVGTLNQLQSTHTQVSQSERSPMVDLFFNTRTRAIEFFGTVDEADINTSAQARLEDYLSSQHRTAHALSLELNATLASTDSLSPRKEYDGSATDYVDGVLYDDFCSWDKADCYGTVAYDGVADGLVTQNDRVLAAIFWLEVESITGGVEEMIVIDVPTTSPSP